MINLLDMNILGKKLPKVTSFEYTVGSKSIQFHPEGLFSEAIFGNKEAKERRTTYGVIQLNCKVLHPALIKPVYRLNSKILKVLEQKTAFDILEDGTLKENQYGDLNGVTSVINNFEKLIVREDNKGIRKSLQNMLMHYYKKNMAFIDYCIVIPPFWREAQVEESGGYGLRIPPINEFYQKIIKLAVQIESLNSEPGDIIYEMHARKMHELISNLYDYIITKVSKKQGMVRQDILGKRVDFSGRAVIVGGSYKIKPDEIGIPYKMLVKLFEPYILYELYNSGNVDRKVLTDYLMEYNQTTLSILTLRNLLSDIQKGHVLSKEFDQLIRDSVNRAISDKVVIAKRDPALHAESVRAFKPVMVDGESIQIAPTCCSGFGADFDGDQMAVYIPLTRQSIEEVKDKMITSSSMDSYGMCADDLSKDFVIGIYNLTKDDIRFKNIKPKVIKDEKELKELHPNYPIIIDGEITTVGRHIFNSIVPSKKYRISGPAGKKQVNKMIKEANNEFFQTNRKVYSEFVANIMRLGAKYYTLIPVTFSIDDLKLPESILKLKPQLDNATPEQAQRIIEKMEKMLEVYLVENQLNLGIIGAAGGLKNGYSQLRQILICKGIVAGPKGTIDTIKDSYCEGMKSYDFFSSGYASRSGIIDRVLNTADTGYLSRRLVYALQRVEANPELKDCGTKKTITLKVTPDIAGRLTGRYVYNEDDKLELFDKDKWMNKIIRLRTPVFCKSTGICRHCYGELLMRNRTRYVGVLAAQILGERLSQVTMKQFHVGGSINVKLINIDEALTSMLDPISKMSYQKQFKTQDTNLLCIADGGKIIIENEYYKDKGDLVVKEGKQIDMTYGFFTIDMDSYKIDVAIDNKIQIPLDKNKLIRTENGYEILFSPGTIVFIAVPTPQIFSKQVKIIDALFSGKSPFKSPDHFVQKVYETYKGLGSGADMVHYEVLVSNLLRDKGNPAYPARINPDKYDAIVISLNSIPKMESWLQAFAFQDPKDAIMTGLIYQRPSKETILEKLITGNL